MFSLLPSRGHRIPAVWAASMGPRTRDLAAYFPTGDHDADHPVTHLNPDELRALVTFPRMPSAIDRTGVSWGDSRWHSGLR